MNDPKNKAFLDACQSALDKQVSEQSPEISNRLANARKQALGQQPEIRPTQLWVNSLQRSMFPTGIAMATLLLLTLWLPTQQEELNPSTQETLLSLETLDLLSAEEELDLYEELEFINWLSLQAEQG